MCVCVAVCCERGVSRLVYTSTVNVVFAGKPIEDGDEDSVPCVPLDQVRESGFYEATVSKVNRANPTPGACVSACHTSLSCLISRRVNEHVMNPGSVTRALPRVIVAHNRTTIPMHSSVSVKATDLFTFQTSQRPLMLVQGPGRDPEAGKTRRGS